MVAPSPPGGACQVELAITTSTAHSFERVVKQSRSKPGISYAQRNSKSREAPLPLCEIAQWYCSARHPVKFVRASIRDRVTYSILK